MCWLKPERCTRGPCEGGEESSVVISALAVDVAYACCASAESTVACAVKSNRVTYLQVFATLREVIGERIDCDVFESSRVAYSRVMCRRRVGDSHSWERGYKVTAGERRCDRCQPRKSD